MYSRPKMPLKTKVTLLKIKQIRLKEKYGKGEILHEAKTGTGPILLTISFPYGNYLYLKKAVAGEESFNVVTKLLKNS